MKHAFKLLALAALPLMWSCSADDPQLPDAPVDETPVPGEVRTAYMTINIQDVNGINDQKKTRAEGEGDGGLQQGSEEEHDIKSGIFFFFDKYQKFLTTGHLQHATWGDPDGSDGSEDPDNVEWMGTNILTMPLAENIEPYFLITVLNPTDGLAQLVNDMYEANKNLTMSQVGSIITTYNPYIINAGDQPDNFMMTTTTQIEGNKVVYYTPIDPKTQVHHTITDAKEDQNPVKIYVERLAAKVSLKVEGSTSQYGTNIFPITGALLVDDLDHTTADHAQLYCRVDGWGLSGTTRNSYISKKASPIEIPGVSGNWSWKDPDNFRSYWGEGIWYNQAINDEYIYLGENGGPNTPYPSSANFQLQFVNWNQLLGEVKIGDNGGSPLYCLEHTNKPAQYEKKNADDTYSLVTKNVTCALVKATLGTIVDGKFTALDVIKYNGNLLREDNFLEFVLSNLNQDGHLNYWKQTGTDASGKTTYAQLDKNDFEYKLNNRGTGNIDLFLKSTVDVNNLYKKELVKVDGEATDKFDEVYTQITGTDLANEIRTYINSWGNAMGYKDGAMYYVIPIKHLNYDYATNPLYDNKEGAYGVVRNHHYSITVNKIEKIGFGVYKPGTGETEPGEPLIPDDPDPETHLSAQIHVLSWKLVNQSTDL